LYVINHKILIKEAMKKTLYTFILLCVHMLQAQTGDLEKEKEAIKKLAGCYDVTYRFAETFASDTAYEFHEKHISSAREWIVVDEETKNKIVLQHILILDNGEVMKHWREDWVYENTDGYTYAGDYLWKYFNRDKNSVKGQWTQKVLQVDDSPRYEGSATWLFNDGKTSWQSECMAPLPRREHTTRSDYKVLKRKNIYTFTGNGYTHEEDNVKLIPGTGGDTNIVMEKGLNTYEKIDDSYAENSIKWWKENRDFWVQVRNVWDEVYSKKADLKLYDKVEGKTLFTELLKLGSTYTNPSSGSSNNAYLEIKNLVYKYIKSE
jgi:hypothetical protein